MENGNYLNIKNHDEKNKEIYRVMPVHYLIELFKMNENVLVKPHKWNDPFENFILKSKWRNQFGMTGKFDKSIRDSLFGQCWTLEEEIDAMWRIYSYEKNGVKIRTTIRKLYESLYNALPINYRDIQCFIGKVIYIKRERINEFIKKLHLSLDSTRANIAKTLLIKLDAFNYENEIRLLFMSEGDDIRKEHFKYQVKPLELIEEIVFDPRMNKSLYKILSEFFKEKGFKGEISQSNLYQPPRNIFVNI